MKVENAEKVAELISELRDVRSKIHSLKISKKLIFTGFYDNDVGKTEISDDDIKNELKSYAIMLLSTKEQMIIKQLEKL